jgi:hypothetical protein
MPTAAQEKLWRTEIERWILDPEYWARKFLSSESEVWEPSPLQAQLWDAYRQLTTAKLKRRASALDPSILLTEEEAVLANKQGISVMAGQGLGKEATVAPIGLHFLHVMPEPKVVCTAPAGPTLFSTLWPEFAKWVTRSKYLPQVLTKQSDKIFVTDRGPDPFKIEPRTIQQNSSPEAQGEVLRGIHSTSMLYIVTEASGVEEAVWRPLEGGLTDPIGLIILIFNPTRTTGFAIETQRKYRSHWLCLHWDGEEIKRANPGKYIWYNENAQTVLAEKYGKDSNMYRISVKGLPPKQSSDTLISWDAVMEATTRQFETLPTDPFVIGVDVGGPVPIGHNPDKTVILPRRGPVVLPLYERTGDDTTKVGQVVAEVAATHMMDLLEETQYAVGVDTIGIGRGVKDHLTNIELMRRVYAIDVSEASTDQERFHRLRDQVWWWLRERFMESKDIAIPKDDELIEELTSVTWKEEGGKIKIEGKESIQKKIRRSPNKADALGLTEYLLRQCTSRLPAKGLRRMRRQRKPLNWRTI